MPASASTGQYHNCKYRSTRSPVALDANLLSPAGRIITLTSPYCTYNIVLRPSQPVIVGCSSRSEVKKLSSSTENALFDGLLVSSKHAELELKRNKISITDTGSKHGTFVNSQKLQPSKDFDLSVGDVIRLGDRGQGEHPFTEMRRVTSHADSIPGSDNGVTVTLTCVSVASERLQSQIFAHAKTASSEDDFQTARTASWC
jgi:pSer/pThr/pTyr-binding forkhead associated (FHA) protein